jgi:Ni/Fe-hydrogenase subunit HybB-like protein
MTQMAERPSGLPYGVGRVTSWWSVAVAVAVGVLVFGMFAYARQLSEGEIVTGLRNLGTGGGATWGLYVAFDAYFAGLAAAGIALAVMIRLFRIAILRPLARVGLVLGLLGTILGGFCVIADLGQPFRGIVNLLRYARPGSPFFGTFTLIVAGTFIAALTYLFLDGRRDAAVCAAVRSRLQGFHRLWASGYRDTGPERERHRRASFWLAITILPLLVAAQSTLGLVYGLQVGRPGWYSAIQAPGFVLLAGVSGIGLIMVIAAALRHQFHDERLGTDLFTWLARAFGLLLIAYLYVVFIETISGAYQDRAADSRITTSLLSGTYAWLFWLVIGLILVAGALTGLYLLRASSTVALLVASGVLVNLAVIGKRYLVVVPSQTHGSLLPYETGSYSPTWVEYGVVLGLLALGVLLFLGFVKIFPILSLPDRREEVES